MDNIHPVQITHPSASLQEVDPNLPFRERSALLHFLMNSILQSSVHLLKNDAVDASFCNEVVLGLNDILVSEHLVDFNLGHDLMSNFFRVKFLNIHLR